MTRLAKCFAVIALPVALAGCVGAEGELSEILPLGPDTFKLHVSGPVWYMNEIEARALSSANAYCLKLNKVYLATTFGFVATTYNVTFRCLSQGDPELKRASIGAAPDVIIENRNR